MKIPGFEDLQELEFGAQWSRRANDLHFTISFGMRWSGMYLPNRLRKNISNEVGFL
jgi:hypothetical protein